MRRLYPDTPAVFIDTGLEYPEIREFVKTFENVVILRPIKYEREERRYVRTNFRQVIYENGYPIISKEVAKRVVEYHNAERKGTLENSSAYKEFNDLALRKYGDKSFYNKGKWKFLLDAPFKISNKCCDIMKKNPAKKYEKETGQKPIIGTMACESRARRSKWKMYGCNSFDSKKSSSKPLSFWTENDVLEYIVKYIKPEYDKAWFCAENASGSRRRKGQKFLRRHNYGRTGIASAYGDIVLDKNGKYHTTGCQRTGCVFCGFGCHLEKEPNRFQKLKQTHPKLWEYCMKSWEGGGLGMKEVLEFIGVKIE